jgi:ketosteroid isomerase-like protein
MTLSPADRLDILGLLTRADAAASARDVEGYLSLLTADMVLDGDQGTHRGTSALRRALAAVWATEPKATLHLTLNPVIDAGEQPGLAVARSVLLIVNPGPPPALAATARITQDLRQEDGQWKISRRTVSA